MAFDLRPLTLGELLDRSFTLYRRHVWLFVGLMAIPSVFTLIFTVGSELVNDMIRANMDPDGEVQPVAIAGVFAGSVAFVVVFVGYLIAYMMTLGATTVAVSEIYVGRMATIAGAYSHIRGQVGRLMLLMLLVGLRLFGIFVAGTVLIGLTTVAAAAIGGATGGAIAGLGAMLLLVGTMLAVFVFSLRYAVAVPSLALEDVTAGESIRRSIALTRGSLGRAAVLVVFAMIVTYGAVLILQGPFLIAAMMAGEDTAMAFWLGLLGAVTGTIGAAVTGPVMIIALALFYYDVRIRKEGLDLQLMIAGLDHTPAAPATAG